MNLKKIFVYQISAFVLISANVMLTWASDDTLPIPHSTISTAIGKGITKATFSCPTNRYPHGVLGDRIEAACLLLENENKVQFKVALPETQVFEDLNPRIADIDNDGRNDVVVVRSDNSVGAAIVVYSIVGKSVEELASTPAIGSSFRWLAPIDILDFNGDGLLDIAYVQTPHIGGVLRFWTFDGNQLQLLASRSGFSNHRIGSSRISTSLIVDHNQDGNPDIALPDQSRTKTTIVTLETTGTEHAIKQLHEQPYDSSYFD